MTTLWRAVLHNWRIPAVPRCVSGTQSPYFLESVTRIVTSQSPKNAGRVRELREFSNFAKTRVRMYSFHMLHFNVLFTSGLTCGDNILRGVYTKLLFLNLNPSARQILFFLFPEKQYRSSGHIPSSHTAVFKRQFHPIHNNKSHSKGFLS